MGAVGWLRGAFCTSLLGTTIAAVAMIHCGLEARRALQRVRAARAEGDRLEGAAAQQLVLAENELNQRLKVADDLGTAAMKTAPADLELRERVEFGRRGLDQMKPQITAAQQKVDSAKQAAAEASSAEERLVRGAMLEQARARTHFLWSIVAVAVGTIATVTTGWSWRKAG